MNPPQLSPSHRPRSRTLADLLEEMAEAQPDAPAAVALGRRVTYEQLAMSATHLAAAFVGMFGMRRGERVAVLCSNRLEWLVTAFAAARAGVSVVAISTWSKATEIEHMLQHERPQLLVTLDRFRSNDYVETWHELLPELWEATPETFRSPRFPSLRNVVVIGGAAKLPAAHRFADVLRQGAVLEPVRSVRARAADVALVLYTSGSSAMPKAVPLLHYGCVENGFDIGERAGIRRSDRGWLALPLSWSYGSAIALMSLATHGACTVLQEAFDAAEALDLIERERCTVYFGQANIAHALVGHPAFRPERCASLRTGLTTGTPDDVRLTAENLGVHGVCNIYGATEAYGQISVAWTGDPLEQRMNGQGPPLPGQTVRVVDPDTGLDVPEGELGEFWVKGYLTPGYLDDPEQTRAAFSDDGFFRTGDVGTIDGDGYLHFKARRKEMIKTGGINVSPLEVEAFLQGCPGVVEGCVVGLPHAVKGEVVAALVRLARGSTLSAQDLRAQCKARMAAYKVPEIIVFVDELPRTDTGKLSRKKSAELLARKLEATAS